MPQILSYLRSDHGRWALLLIACYLILLTAFAVPPWKSLSVIGYLALFVGIPAFVLQHGEKLGTHWSGYVFALAIAHALETVSYLLLLRTDATVLFYAYPLPWLVYAWHHRQTLQIPSVPRFTWLNTLSLLGVFALIFGGIVHDFGGNEHHALWLMSYTNAVASSVPPLDPFFAGQPLLYHYFYNAHAVAIHQITRISHYELLRFLLPVSEYLLCLSTILAAGTRWYRHRRLGLLILIQFLAYYGYGYIQYENFQTANLSIIYRIPSMLPALAIFVTLIVLADSYLSESRNFICILVLLVAVAGFRGNVLPMLLCGFAASTIVFLGIDKTLAKRGLTLTITTIMAFSATFWALFYGENHGANIMKFSPLSATATWSARGEPSPFFEWIASGLGERPLSVLVFLLAVFTFKLSGFAPCLAGLFHPDFSWRVPRRFLLLFIWIAGLAVVVLFRNGTNEQWAFYIFGHLALTLLIADAADTLLSNPQVWPIQRRLVVLTAVLLFAVQVIIFFHAMTGDFRKPFFQSDYPIPPSSPLYQLAEQIADKDLTGVIIPYESKQQDIRGLTSLQPGLVLHHSWVGAMYMSIAGLHPEMARRLALVDSPPTCQALRDEKARFAALGEFYLFTDLPEYNPPEDCTELVVQQDHLRLYRVTP